MVDQMKNLKSSQWHYEKLIGLRILLNLKCLSQFKYDILYNGQSITSLQLSKILPSMQINVLQLQGNFVWNDFGLFHRLLNKTEIYSTLYFWRLLGQWNWLYEIFCKSYWTISKYVCKSYYNFQMLHDIFPGNSKWMSFDKTM